jgi:hypothetical protein
LKKKWCRICCINEELGRAQSTNQKDSEMRGGKKGRADTPVNDLELEINTDPVDVENATEPDQH